MLLIMQILYPTFSNNFHRPVSLKSVYSEKELQTERRTITSWYTCHSELRHLPALMLLVSLTIPSATCFVIGWCQIALVTSPSVLYFSVVITSSVNLIA